MFSKQNLPLKKELLNSLVFDYLSDKKELNGFYNFFPDKGGFRNAIDAIRTRKYDRSLLTGILREQCKNVKNTSPASEKNIELLLNENTYTITTGHQLCLFTGPLYFIYKIFSVINLSEKLKNEFPENNFVPVYWMASEDHDFEEVNHLNIYSKKIEWHSSQKGAVGNFYTEELLNVKKELHDILGKGDNNEFLFNLFTDAYLKHSDLASATRYLVNELFGKYGLIVLDGNSKQLKESFIPFFEKDIFENIPGKNVNDSISELKSMKYEPQVNPRAVNCFYMEDGIRARIEKEGEDYKVVGTDKKFTENEFRQIIKTNEQKISPNVVLRPCYQQFILPNLAYVGGPGELAYWLEYKAMFDKLNLFYPVLVPRRFVTVIDKNTAQKINKLGFDINDVFRAEQDLVKDYLGRNAELKDLGNYKNEIEKLYSKLNEDALQADKTLGGAVEAEKQKVLNSINMIEQKINKAIKQKSENELNQIRLIKEKLFPGGIAQERVDNFSMYYSKWGKEFIDFLKDNLNYDLEKQYQLVIKED